MKQIEKRKSYRSTQIIAVDFDGTLCEDCYPEIGQQNIRLFSYLKRKRRQGARLILWTCRTGLMLEQAVYWCHNHELEFDAVNENLPEIVAEYGGDSRKIFADIYIDDRSVDLGFESESRAKIG